MSVLQVLLVAGLILLSAVIMGLVAAFGSVKFAVLLAAALLGAGLLALPVPMLMGVMVFTAFVVVGQLFYFAGMGQAVWIVFGFGLLLFVKWLLLSFNSAQPLRVDALSALVWLFLLAVLLSVLLNLPPVLQAVAGGKNLVAIWGVFFIVAAGSMSTRAMYRVWQAFFWLLLFQVPLVLYQYLVVAPSRTRFGATTGGVEWDAVVGGFGGDPDGGGYSGGMAFFVCVAIAFAVAAYRRGLIGPGRLAVALLAGALCVGLAEVKVVVVLLPVAALAMFAPELFKRPLLALLGIPASLVLALGVLVAYESVHYGNSGPTSSSPAEIVERAFSYSLDPDQINFRSGEMGRVAAVKHWWMEHDWSDPARLLFGHGPGASRGTSIVGAGEAARRYPFLIDRSAATQILWDIGLFGFLCYFGLCVVAAIKALRLSRVPGLVAEEAAMLQASAAGLAMLLVMLFYGRDPLEAPAVALLIALMLGFVAWQDKRLRLCERGGSRESRSVGSGGGAVAKTASGQNQALNSHLSGDPVIAAERLPR